MSELDEMRDKATRLFASIFWDGYNKWYEAGRDYPFNEKFTELLSLSTNSCRIAVVRKKGELPNPYVGKEKKVETVIQPQYHAYKLAQQKMVEAGYVQEVQHDARQ